MPVRMTTGRPLVGPFNEPSSFRRLHGRTGHIQAYVKRGMVGKEAFATFK